MSAAAHAGAAGRARARRPVRFNVAIGLVGLANIFDPGADRDLRRAGERRRAVPRPDPPPLPRPHRGRRRTGRPRRSSPRRWGSAPASIGAALLALDRPARPGARGEASALTLPSFVEDPEAAARAWRGPPRPRACTASSCTTTSSARPRRASCGPRSSASALLGAVAAETERISIGTLVARATLRPPATLAAALDTVLRIAGPRAARRARRRRRGEPGRDGDVRPAVRHRGGPGDGAARGRCASLRDRGYPVWVGGRARHVGLVAAEGADGWNRWGGDAETFARELAEVRGLVRAARRTSPRGSPRRGAGSCCSAATEAEAEAKRAKRVSVGART